MTHAPVQHLRHQNRAQQQDRVGQLSVVQCLGCVRTQRKRAYSELHLGIIYILLHTTLVCSSKAQSAEASAARICFAATCQGVMKKCGASVQIDELIARQTMDFRHGVIGFVLQARDAFPRYMQ